MKKLVLLSLLVGIAPMTMSAQDDMYFSPKKEKAERSAQVRNEEIPAYYSGSSRSVDEYNRRGFGSGDRRGFGSHYQVIGGDSIGNDAIDFYGDTPDSLYVGKGAKASKHRPDYDADDYDYAYSRRMRYFDDFFWYDDPWLYGDPWYRSYYGYYGPYYGYYGWRSPWRYGYYAGWYDPWYYGYGGWWGDWYDPWYTGWHRPYWGPTIAYRPYNPGGVTGTANHGRVDNGRRGGGADFYGYRGSNSTSSRNTDAYNRQNRNSGFSGYRGGRDNASLRNTDRVNGNDAFRNTDAFQRNDAFRNESGFRNESSFGGGASRSGSFGGGFSGGGNRGGGFSGGGGRVGGGGHFGGRR